MTKPPLDSQGSTTTTTGSSGSSAFSIVKTQQCIQDDKHFNKSVQLFKASSDKRYLAMAMSGGKVVYIVSLESSKIVVGLSRGIMSKAVIKSMSFSFDNRYLVLVSDKLSVHVFHLDPYIDKSASGSKKLTWLNSFMKFKTHHCSE
jgi:hypothetical protein